jgi:thymidylate kinase
MENGVSNSETNYWRNARHILAFTGICGTGKTTLSSKIVNRCRAHGAIASGTVDWDPHVPDHHRLTSRAFRRDLDLAMIADPLNTDIHRQIVDHSLRMIDEWKKLNANLIVVDRFVESYDYLPSTAVRAVQSALKSSGFTVSQVLLTIGLYGDSHARIADRLLQTKDHRPKEWWDSGPGDVEQFAAEEVKCQAAYRTYCAASPFATAVIDTTKMEWDQYEQALVDQMMLDNEITNRPWTESMKRHAINAYPIDAPSSRLGMSRPGFDWFATMRGVSQIS